MASKGLVSALLGTLLLAFSPSRGDAVCVGDCDSSGRVFPNELQLCVNIILRKTAVTACTPCDRNGNGVVTPDELQAAVLSILRPTNCPMVQPTRTPTPGSPTPTPTPTTPVAEGFCGDGIVQGDEECDDGGACFGGTNEGNLCTSQAACPGGECRGFGGDGCAVNCTVESEALFSYAGAICVGGAKDGEPCTFRASCQGGPKPGRPCTRDQDCGTGGTCVSECGADSVGCFADGECTTGQNVGADCLLTENLQTVKVHTCVGGTRDGQSCIDDKECPGGACTARCIGGTKDGQACPFGDIQCPGGSCGVSPCGQGGVCEPKSRAALVSLFGLEPVRVGPLIGFQNLHVSKPDPDGTIHIAVPAAEGQFEPVKVPGILCACVRGVPNPGVHGPGNSASGMVSCGATVPPVDVTLAQDHNTTPPGVCLRGPNQGQPCTSDAQCGTGNPCNNNLSLGPSNGPGRCVGGQVEGRACFNDADCIGGGTCTNRGQGGGFCMGPLKVCQGGTRDGLTCYNDAECPGGSCPGEGNFLAFCSTHADCPGSLCNSPDDADCTAQDPPPPEGSGGRACRETLEVCVAGPNVGQPCTRGADCGAGGVCANDCAPINKEGHAGVCRSPTHLEIGGPSRGPGSAVVVSTTAIGTISDGGFCSVAKKCVGGSQNGQACLDPRDCPGGTCASATCQGGSRNGQACATEGECPGGECVAFDPAKGLDGVPCTDDDPETSRGVANTIPQSTGLASTLIADVDLVAGRMILHGSCSGGPVRNCAASLLGSPYDCAALTADPPSVGNLRIAANFPALDQQVGDSAVITSLKARPGE